MASGMSFFEVYVAHLEASESIGAIKSYVVSKIQARESSVNAEKNQAGESCVSGEKIT